MSRIRGLALFVALSALCVDFGLAHSAFAQSGLGETAAERLVARGTAALEAGRFASARRSFTRALRLEPNDVTLRAFAKLLADDRAREADAHVFLDATEGQGSFGGDRARAHLLLGEHDAALSLLGQFATPQDALALATLRQLALVYVERGDLRSAERALTLARRVMPQDPTLVRELAALWIAAGSPERAIPLLQARLQLRPDDEPTRRQLACALHAAGRSDEAIASFVDLGSPADLRDASRAALEYGDALRALALATRALSNGDDEAKARVVLGLALAALGRPAEAAIALRRALALDPELSEARGALSGLTP